MREWVYCPFISDCIVVGGGIGGAVLALALGQRGYRVVVFERELVPQGTARPEILAKSTMETFQRLGVADRMLKEAVIPLKKLELFAHGNQPLFHFGQEEFLAADSQPYSTDPGLTRRILLEAAQAHGSVQIHRPVEVRDLWIENGFVRGVHVEQGEEKQTWKSRLVVGDDGGKSHVRAGLGIPLTTRDFVVDFLAAVGPALPGHQEGLGQAYVAPERIRDGLIGGIFMPLPGQRTALVFMATPAVMERFKKGSPADFYAAAARLSPRCKGLEKIHRFPEGFGYFRRPFGHASRYVANGAALLGDAAHPVTPAGGQGANMSVADAMALADVASDAFSKNDCSATALAAYETNRRQANAHSLSFSSRVDHVIRILHYIPWASPLLLRYLSSIEHSPKTKQKFIQAVSRAFLSDRSIPS